MTAVEKGISGSQMKFWPEKRGKKMTLTLSPFTQYFSHKNAFLYVCLCGNMIKKCKKNIYHKY